MSFGTAVTSLVGATALSTGSGWVIPLVSIGVAGLIGTALCLCFYLLTPEAPGSEAPEARLYLSLPHWISYRLATAAALLLMIGGTFQTRNSTSTLAGRALLALPFGVTVGVATMVITNTIQVRRPHSGSSQIAYAIWEGQRLIGTVRDGDPEDAVGRWTTSLFVLVGEQFSEGEAERFITAASGTDSPCDQMTKRIEELERIQEHYRR